METKTIEERALDFVEKLGIDHYSPLFDVCQEDYRVGAIEQKAIDIDKACEYLDIYFMEIGYPDDWLRDSPNIESGRERFIKAMEG